MLKDKVALVTGASSGIGRAIALVLAREGAKIVAADLNREGGEETAKLVRDQGGEALCVVSDVTRPEEAESLVSQVVQHYLRLDIAHLSYSNLDFWLSKHIRPVMQFLDWLFRQCRFSLHRVYYLNLYQD